MKEERKIIVDKEEIRYLFTRKHVKNMNLRVKNDGSVHVSAPMRTPVSHVDDFVRLNAVFVMRARKRVKRQEALRILQDGATVFFLGDAYILTFAIGKRSLVFADGRAYLTLPKEPADLERAYLSLVGERILPMIKERCMDFEASFPHLAGKAKDIRMRFMKSMWANCRPREGRLTFSSALATMPIPLIDGVIAHEYAHFFHSGHGADFYAFLATLTPDYKELDQALKKEKREQLLKRYSDIKKEPICTR